MPFKHLLCDIVRMREFSLKIISADMPSLAVSLKIKTIHIAVGNDWELITTISCIHIDMLVVMTA